MASERFTPFLPLLQGWIKQTLDFHSGARRSIASFDFKRLPSYVSQSILTTTGVVIVDRIPVPPLSAIGLAEFAGFETQPKDGITYMDTYFVRTKEANSESLHFHELVHVIQWQVLGPEAFLLTYAEGLAKHEYRDSPLEAIAFDHQARFDDGELPYPLEAEVREQTLALAGA